MYLEAAFAGTNIPFVSWTLKKFFCYRKTSVNMHNR